MENREAINIITAKMDVHQAVFGHPVGEPLKTAYETAIAALEQQRWIPVTERLPEERDVGVLKKLGTDKRSDYVLATVEVKGERMTVTACTYDGKWDWNMKYAFPDYKVLAWMPFPETYQEDKE